MLMHTISRDTIGILERIKSIDSVEDYGRYLTTFALNMLSNKILIALVFIISPPLCLSVALFLIYDLINNIWLYRIGLVMVYYAWFTILIFLLIGVWELATQLYRKKAYQKMYSINLSNQKTSG